MKLLSEKNLHGDEGRNTDAGTANVTSLDKFEEGEFTLIRPDRHHHDDPRGSGDKSEREKNKKNQ